MNAFRRNTSDILGDIGRHGLDRSTMNHKREECTASNSVSVNSIIATVYTAVLIMH